MSKNWYANHKYRVLIHFLIITTYLIYFFIVNETQVIIIKQFGPAITKAGQEFNLQSHQTSTIWFQTEGVSNDSIVAVWEDTQLKTVVSVDEQSVIAVVPKELFSSPDNFEIYLFDVKNNIQSNKVIFKEYWITGVTH